MPLFDAVTPAHVNLAMEEHDELGPQEFRDRYGFGPAREYVLVHDGRSYDSKAVLGVALKHATGRPATSEEFSGGKEGAAKVLADLGFEVTSVERDAADLSRDEAHAEWAVAAREELLETARRYQGVTTYKELAASVQQRTGIRTARPQHYWIGDVLTRVALDSADRGEPILSALCVNAEGSVGASYGEAIRQITGTMPADPDSHAAAERLSAYQRYDAVGLPSGGGTKALTPQLSASRTRSRKRFHAEKAPSVCPTCQMAVPATGICDSCD